MFSSKNVLLPHITLSKIRDGHFQNLNSGIVAQLEGIIELRDKYE